jgi:hypothetical protein
LSRWLKAYQQSVEQKSRSPFRLARALRCRSSRPPHVEHAELTRVRLRVGLPDRAHEREQYLPMPRSVCALWIVNTALHFSHSRVT